MFDGKIARNHCLYTFIKDMLYRTGRSLNDRLRLTFYYPLKDEDRFVEKKMQKY